MATRQELRETYQTLYGKDIPSATLSKWCTDGRIRYEVINGRNNYNLNDFISIITSESYKKRLRAHKEKPEDYIGKTKGDLLITGIVPSQEKAANYNGTLMYCNCLNCGKEKVQVRFTYLSDNGNYDQLTCGCGRKTRAFLASCRSGIDEAYLKSFSDFEKFLFVHKLLTHITDNYYGTKCDLNVYKQAVSYIYNDKQFNKVYSFWLNNKNKSSTYYDLSKPSIDHIIPLSRGGTSHISNLQVLTVFENLAKRDMTLEEWNDFKKNTNTHSNYFIEEIMKESEVVQNED